MDRRTFLGAGGVTLAGCLSNPSDEEDGTPTRDDGGTPTAELPDDERRYDECDVLVLPYSRLPPEPREEVGAALEGGEYRTEDRLHLADALDVERSYVRVEHTYYRAEVARDGGETVLTLEETVPELESPAPLMVENRSGGVVTVRLTVTGSDEAVVVDEERRLETDSEAQYGELSRFDTYAFRVRTDTDLDERFDAGISEHAMDVWITVDDEGVGYGQAVVDPAPCPWEDDYQG